jgi:hypothetical protein
MYLKGESLGFDLVGLWQSNMYKIYKVLDGLPLTPLLQKQWEL